MQTLRAGVGRVRSARSHLGPSHCGASPLAGVGAGIAALPRSQAQVTHALRVQLSCRSTGTAAETNGALGGPASKLPQVLGISAGVLGAGALAYTTANCNVQEVNISIKQVSEDVFDTSDNLFVFFLDRPEDLTERKNDMQKITRAVAESRECQRVKYYHNVKKEGDPPMPDVPASQEENSPPPLRCIMYKGQRKSVIYIDDETPVDKVAAFFTPISEDEKKLSSELPVQFVSRNTFVQDVLKESSPSQPILLQMYEDTCFLCFLMRPFINSLAALFKEHGIPLRFKRLNIETNDFPDRCPVARGTPTFVLFRGPNADATKWEEFKPRDLCERITKEFPIISDENFAEMDDLQGLVTQRFQLFTQLVMWTMELQRMQDILAAPTVSGLKASSDEPRPKVAKDDDDAMNTVVTGLMLKDMRRTDSLNFNLKHLQREVDEVEHDAALLGVMLAESVQRREAEERLMLDAAKKRGRK